MHFAIFFLKLSFLMHLVKLWNQLFHCNNNFMLTYNDHPEIRHMYGDGVWCNITEIPVTYGENQSGKGKRAVELVIRNY
jgi:hypothetical protein